MNQEKIGKFIAILRKERGLTQEELANKLGITKNAVSKWERGISLMDMSLLNPLCEILGISITELLNGEKIEKNDIKEKSDEVIKNTFKYTNKEIKKNKIKTFILTILGVIALLTIIFFGYKLYLVNKYNYKLGNDIEKQINGLKISKEVKIYKKTYNEEDYLDLGYLKIRNDFKNYQRKEKNNEMLPDRFTFDKDGKHSGINFASSEQMINLFVSEATFYGSANNIEKKYNAANRKYFLLRNDINNDIDFYKYIVKNYNVKNNVFMSKRELMENYSLKVFIDIAIPLVKDTVLISGDYDGIIQTVGEDNKKVIQVQLIKNNKLYGFTSNDERLYDEAYLYDLIGSIEIK